MDSDSEKENYFSLYMKRRINDSKKKTNFRSDKKTKNNCASIQKLKEDKKINPKLLLESSDKKNKITFSFIKSYLFNFQDQEKNKKCYAPVSKDLIIDKTKSKNVRVNKSSTDINCNKKNVKKNNEIDKTNLNSKKNYTNNKYDNNDNKIEKLKNRIFNLMEVIDNFEKDYINNKKPIQIKEQLNKINFGSHNIQQIKSNKNKTNEINYLDEHLYVTDRINYNKNKKFNNQGKKNIIRINEELDICNYYDYDYDNKILTKRNSNSNKKKSRATSSKIIDKNKPIIMLNYKQNNNNNNSTFMKLISSNSSSKNELNKTNYNGNKYKGKVFINQLNSNSNKTIYKNKNYKNQKESSIFKRRINYSNFINQKMKQNIIHRNHELYLKQNLINKSIYSYNNSNNSNGFNPQIGMNNNYYYNGEIQKENNNKNNSLDKNLKLNDLNNIIKEKEVKSSRAKNRNINKNDFYNNYDYNNEIYKNYFFSENRDNNVNNKDLLDK